MFRQPCCAKLRFYHPVMEALEARNLLSFLPAVNYPVGAAPVDIAVADFDNDNIPDLAVTNRDGTVSILLGNGDGTFRSALNFPAGDSPTGVTLGDFNGDGNLDLAVTNYGFTFGNVGVTVLLGNGDGTFQPPVFYRLSGIDRPEAIAAADFDNDGNLDLAVVNVDFAPLSVLLGNGDGTFQTPVNYGNVAFANSLAVADLTGNGNMDIVVANTFSDILTVYYGDGAGTFPTSQSFSAPRPVGVAIGDVNGDGIPDLVATELFDPQLDLLLGNGDGTFGSPLSYNIGAAFHGDGVVLADFTGDGILDVATANVDDNNVSVLLGNGDGSFQSGQTYGVGNYPVYLAAGDFNGDGFPDLVTANFYVNSVSVLINAADWGGPSPAPRQDARGPGRDESISGRLPLEALSTWSRGQDAQALPQAVWTLTGGGQQSMQHRAMAADSGRSTEPESRCMPTSVAAVRYAPDPVLEAWVDPLADVVGIHSRSLRQARIGERAFEISERA
jgi:hypothetical protein